MILKDVLLELLDICFIDLLILSENPFFIFTENYWDICNYIILNCVDCTFFYILETYAQKLV